MKFDKKYLLAIIPLAIVLGLLYYFRTIVSYVIIAWVVSMIGAPLVVFLRRYLGKTLAATATLFLFGIIFGLILYIFIPPLVNQAKYLSSIDYQKVVNSLEEPLEDWENWLANKGLLSKRQDTEFIANPANDGEYIFNENVVLDSLVRTMDSSVVTHVSINLKIDASDLNYQRQNINQNIEQEDFFGKLRKNLMYYINPSRIQSMFTSTVSAFGNMVVGIMSVMFIAFFFLKEQGLFYEMIKTAVPVEYEERTTHAIDESSKLLIRYFIGIFIQITIVTIVATILLSALGIQNALLIAFFAAIMNVIPYMGPIIGASFGAIITISSNLNVSFYNELFPQLIKVFIVFGIVQLIDNFILQPNIFSKSVKAHPLEIFLIVLIGAKLGGILGMVLAIPLYTVMRVIGKVFLSEFKVIQRLTKNI
ncbi:MAG TPA: AI-2E family transporter [Saprospiraceae bacterium]|nr:AI-2E family transporter [Saprospiraceae bacterium]